MSTATPIRTTLSPIWKLGKMLAVIIGLLLALVGAILLISGSSDYFTNNVGDDLPFEQLLLALGFLGIPFSGVLFYKTHQSLEQGESKYGLPDSPLRSLSLIILTIMSVILTVSAFVIIAVLF